MSNSKQAHQFLGSSRDCRNNSLAPQSLGSSSGCWPVSRLFHVQTLVKDAESLPASSIISIHRFQPLTVADLNDRVPFGEVIKMSHRMKKSVLNCLHIVCLRADIPQVKSQREVDQVGGLYDYLHRHQLLSEVPIYSEPLRRRPLNGLLVIATGTEIIGQNASSYRFFLGKLSIV